MHVEEYAQVDAVGMQVLNHPRTGAAERPPVPIQVGMDPGNRPHDRHSEDDRSLPQDRRSAQKEPRESWNGDGDRLRGLPPPEAEYQTEQGGVEVGRPLDESEGEQKQQT